jgi:hypothetical protein
LVAALACLLLPASLLGGPAPDPLASSTLAKYNLWAHSLETIRGGGKAKLAFVEDKTRSFRFALALERPLRLRLQGRLGPTAAVFDLGTTGELWTLYLPQQREVVRGTRESTAGPLGTPQDMALALLPEPIHIEGLRVDGAVSREGSFLRVVAPPGLGSPYHRVLLINSSTGLPSKIVLRKQTQLEDPILTVQLSDYKEHDGVWFPSHVHMEASELWGTLEFTSVRLNEQLDPRRFNVRVPAGVTEIDAHSLDSGFLPVEDSK